MNEHLMLITIGPVQDFIAQARRTRDLWFGSHLVSELSRSVARSLSSQGARLIFPAMEPADPELQKCAGTLRPSGKPPISVANKILATVNSNPESIARQTRDDLYAFWRDEISKVVKDSCLPLLADSVDEQWTEQIESFLEFAAAWVPLEGNYGKARNEVEAALAGRKKLRDFEQFHFQRGAPKSSLDGARESILRKDAGSSKSKLATRYRIAKNEQLDAVGLVKRAGGTTEQFASIVNVALAPWINIVAEQEPTAFRLLLDQCTKLGLSKMRSDLPCTKSFPFDAEIFIPTRWKSVFDQENLDQQSSSWGAQYVEPILRKFKEPSPYVACLVADGDKVGAALSTLKASQEHYSFSRSLSEFAGNAREIIELKHNGALIYAGGDDVLAFLPVSEALVCADNLRQSFRETMNSSGLDLSEVPTLSVGIGIGHTIESMADLLNLGREAEKLAKNGSNEAFKRNGLGIILEKRSGSRRSWRARWDQDDPVTRLMSDALILLDSKLSIRKLYAIESILRRLPDPDSVDSTENEQWLRLLTLELQFILLDSDSSLAGLGIDLSPDNYSVTHQSLREWIDRMIIAREIAACHPSRTPQAKERLQKS